MGSSGQGPVSDPSEKYEKIRWTWISWCGQPELQMHVYFCLFKDIYFFLFLSFLIYLCFNWRIIALQNFVFCQTSTWISHRYTYIPSLLNFPPSPSPSHPSRWCRAPVWISWAIQQIPIGYLFTYGNGSFHVTLSIHPTLFSLSPSP